MTDHRQRLTIEPWEGHPPWTRDDISSWVVCVDGETIGKPVSGEEAAAVHNWLQDGALMDLEAHILHVVEDLYEEEFQNQVAVLEAEQGSAVN